MSSAIEIDEFFHTTDGIVSDPIIKQILNAEFDSSKPDPSIWIEIKIKFTKTDNQNIRKLVDIVTPFDFNQDVEAHTKNNYYGPIKNIQDGRVYVGQLDQNNQPEGHGIEFLEGGNFYEGYFMNSCANIKGRLIFFDGDMYIGELNNNSLQGHGTYFKKDGSKFIGTFMNDLSDGYGKEEWEDGSSYNGNYKRGAKHGPGEFKFANGNKYVGNFEEDLFSGLGTFIKTDGNNFEGNWIENVLQSPAKIQYANGTVYNGQIENYSKHGKGELQDHSILYIGSWLDNKMNGEIILKMQDGTIQKANYDHGKFISCREVM